MFIQLYIPVLVALSTIASPSVPRKGPITIPVARRFNFTSSKTILERDQVRARALKTSSSGTALSITNVASAYEATVEIGSPPQTFQLLVDTGSSNTWVGAGTAYVPTSTSSDTGNEVEVSYGSGFFFGEEYTDEVILGGLTIEQQSIGVAEFAEGFDGFDGILGIGPTDLTAGTVSSGDLIPTVTDNAFSSGQISTKEVGISFEPFSAATETNGELTFGGIDASKYTGSLNAVPITSTAPASSYVGIDQSITYGDAGSVILSSTAGIVDTGTTLILLASDALATYMDITGAVSDETTGFLTISNAQYANLNSLYFNIGGESYEITANAQTWPRSLNTNIGGNADSVYLIIGDLGSDSGEGLDFINGLSFLERYYHVYDSGNNLAKFAETSFTFATTN